MRFGGMFVEWLRSGLDHPGKSQRGLAQHMGVHESVVSRMLSGERDIKARELAQIASYLGVPMPPSRAFTERHPAQTVQVTKIAAFGVWRERGAIVPVRTVVPAVPDPRFIEQEQFAVFLEGDHKYAICINYTSTERPGHGDIIVAERINGSLVETTLRRISLSPAGWNATLFSSVPVAGEVIHSLDEIDVVGRVVGFFEPV